MGIKVCKHPGVCFQILATRTNLFALTNSRVIHLMGETYTILHFSQNTNRAACANFTVLISWVHKKLLSKTHTIAILLSFRGSSNDVQSVCPDVLTLTYDVTQTHSSYV